MGIKTVFLTSEDDATDGSTIGLRGGTDGTLPTAGALPVSWRHDDHYGFGSLSCIE
jgi:hypothetical protein